MVDTQIQLENANKIKQAWVHNRKNRSLGEKY